MGIAVQQTIFITGLTCLIAAIVGGGLRAFGIEIPLLSSRARQLILGLLGLILITAGVMPPNSWDVIIRPNGGKILQTDGVISVRCTASPHAIPAGGQVEIRVLAFTEKGSPIPSANVRIESGGGWFSGSETTTEVGNTDTRGVFGTSWRSPQPAAAAYEMNVSVTKEGFSEGNGECHVPIQ